MTKDDIIRMAHDAGLHLATDVNWMPIVGFEYAEKFATLVVAAEREACAKLFDNHNVWDEEVGERIRARSQA